MIPFTGGTWSSQIHTDAKYNGNCQVGGREGGEVRVRWIQSFSLGRLVDGVMVAGSECTQCHCTLKWLKC